MKAKPNRKDGRFSSYVFLGYTADGKERRKYVYATSKKELDEKLLDVKIQQATGQLVGEKIKLCNWSAKWIKNKCNLSERTQKMYRDNLDRYIIPALGEMQLTDLKPFHIQDLMNDLADRPRTAQIVRMILDQMFRYAIENELMIKNPVVKRKMPNRSAPKRRTTALEEKAIEKANLTDMERVFVYLCRYAGLRRSEARAVMSSDIHDGKLTVSRSVAPDGSLTPFGKSTASYRTIPLRTPLKAILAPYKANGLYLIANSQGKPLTDNQYRRFWGRIQFRLNKAVGGQGKISEAKQYKISLYAIGRDLSAHILRHTFATELAEAGYTPAEIQYLMGHSTARLAQEVYTHIDSTKISMDKLDPATTPLDTALTP